MHLAPGRVARLADVIRLDVQCCQSGFGYRLIINPTGQSAYAYSADYRAVLQDHNAAWDCDKLRIAEGL